MPLTGRTPPDERLALPEAADAQQHHAGSLPLQRLRARVDPAPARSGRVRKQEVQEQEVEQVNTDGRITAEGTMSPVNAKPRQPSAEPRHSAGSDLGTYAIPPRCGWRDAALGLCTWCGWTEAEPWDHREDHKRRVAEAALAESDRRAAGAKEGE